MPSDRWPEALRFHGSAASSFAAVAEAIEAEAWDRPLMEGKWSPAQITDHLIRTYDVLLREIAGGGGMKIRTRLWMRLILRLTLMPRILRTGRFPARAPAPPEIRPGKTPPGQKSGVELFRQRASEFEAAAQGAGPQVPMTHAYFGAMPLADGVVFCARHLEHHRNQLSGRRAG